MSNKKIAKIVSFAVAFIIISSCGILLKVTDGYAVYTSATTKRELPIYSVKRDDKKISVSFDCAWGNDYTAKILDTLDEYNVRCTFFAVQFWVEKNPDLVKEIVKRGHEIGTHSAT
ncbi:MAG: polysaccharide deacetylase family protein, partial [Clostridia bacterium]|nr:polysaccharide deacetylase family protein [Clostridia bacterium]